MAGLHLVSKRPIMEPKGEWPRECHLEESDGTREVKDMPKFMPHHLCQLAGKDEVTMSL